MKGEEWKRTYHPDKSVALLRLLSQSKSILLDAASVNAECTIQYYAGEEIAEFRFVWYVCLMALDYG